LPSFLETLSTRLRLAALVFAVFGGVFLPSRPAAAIAPLLADYSHKAWGPQDGAPNDVVQFAQTTDGWLWLASPNGLFRFDGVRFERIDSLYGQPLHSTNVMGLLGTPDGSLWIGHRFGGVTQVSNGRLTLHPPDEGLPGGTVLSIAVGPDGAIWASTSRGLGHLAPGARRFVTVGIDSGLPLVVMHKVLFTRDGRQWVASAQGMYYRDPGAQRYRRAWPQLPMASMDQAPDGTLWASDGKDKHYRMYPSAPRGDLARRSIPGGHGVHFDRDGVMWTLKQEVLERRIAPYLAPGDGQHRAEGAVAAATQQLGQNNGISGPLPQMWFQDKEGNIWIGTSAGIDRLRRNRVRTLLTGVTLGSPGVIPEPGGRVIVGDISGPLRSGDATGLQTIVAPMPLHASHRAADGAVWVGDSTARWRRGPDGRWTRFSHPPAVSGHSINAMLQGSDGRMWVAMQRFGLFKVDRDDWRPNGDLAALPRDLPLALAGDAAGRVWVGYVGSRIACIDNGRVQVYGEADGLKLGNVQSLMVDGARIWAGGERGVAYLERGRWFALAAPLRGISGMARTPDGDLWLHGAEGITRVAAADVDRVLARPGQALVFERFDALDGLRGSAQQGRPLPSLAQGSDGRLWFSTASNVATVDPRRIARNRLAPPVHIVALRANGRTYDGPRIDLPVGTGELEIAYTALSLTMPERVRFRYRMHGVDRDWQDAGPRRVAFYNSLQPGTYRFQTIAANEDGVWNSTGAEVTVTIPPRFVQTRWFLALLLILTALVLYGLYRLRVRTLTRRMNDVLHARLAERSRIARGLHDTLLQSVQGLIMFFDQQARRLPTNAEERHKIEQTLVLADQLMSEGRDYILDLRSAAEPRELGEALHEYGKVLLHGLLTVSVSGRPHDLAPPVREELHAIAREALFNCARHAGASKVDVRLDYGSDGLQLQVRDDGAGTASDRPGHYGLSGMRERAEAIGATFTLVSAPGRGTCLDLFLAAERAYADTRKFGRIPLARLRRRFFNAS